MSITSGVNRRRGKHQNQIALIGALQNLIVTPFQGYQVVGVKLLRLTPKVIDLASFQDALIYGKATPFYAGRAYNPDIHF